MCSFPHKCHTKCIRQLSPEADEEGNVSCLPCSYSRDTLQSIKQKLAIFHTLSEAEKQALLDVVGFNLLARHQNSLSTDDVLFLAAEAYINGHPQLILFLKSQQTLCSDFCNPKNWNNWQNNFLGNICKIFSKKGRLLQILKSLPTFMQDLEISEISEEVFYTLINQGLDNGDKFNQVIDSIIAFLKSHSVPVCNGLKRHFVTKSFKRGFSLALDQLNDLEGLGFNSDVSNLFIAEYDSSDDWFLFFDWIIKNRTYNWRAFVPEPSSIESKIIFQLCKEKLSKKRQQEALIKLDHVLAQTSALTDKIYFFNLVANILFNPLMESRYVPCVLRHVENIYYVTKHSSNFLLHKVIENGNEEVALQILDCADIPAELILLPRLFQGENILHTALRSKFFKVLARLLGSAEARVPLNFWQSDLIDLAVMYAVPYEIVNGKNKITQVASNRKEKMRKWPLHTCPSQKAFHWELPQISPN